MKPRTDTTVAPPTPHGLHVQGRSAGGGVAWRVGWRSEEMKLLHPLTSWGPRSRTWRYVEPVSAKRKTQP